MINKATNKAVWLAMLGIVISVFAPPISAEVDIRKISETCGIYVALDAEPSLDKFPIVVGSLRFGRAVLIAPLIAGEGEGKKFLGRRMPTLAQARGSMERQQLARQVVKELPFVWDVSLDLDHGYEDAELFEKRQRDYEKECRSKLALSGLAGAAVAVDGKPRGKLPLALDLAAGSREIVVRNRGYRSWRQSVDLGPGEERELLADLVRLAAVKVTSEPEGAVVTLDGTYGGQTPTTLYADEGAHALGFHYPNAEPQQLEFEAKLEEELAFETAFEPRPGSCPSWGVSGNLKKGAAALNSLLRGKTLELAIPLHLVVSSTMESELPVTHVVDGRRILFDARRGDHYEELPEGLLGRELRGLSFGEVGAEVLTPPQGTVTVLGVEAKKSTLILKLRHDNGKENAVYVDFTRDAKDISIEEAVEALCWVVAAREA